MNKGLFLTLLFILGITAWAFAGTTYYYYNSTTTGDLSNPSNWWTAAGGTGTQQSAATIFTTAANTLVITYTASTANNSTNPSWNPTATIQVGATTAAPGITLTIGASNGITSPITIKAASSGTNEVDVYSATVPVFGTLDATSTVNYAGSVAQAITTGITYGTLNINNTYTGTITTTSNSGAYISGAGATTTIATAFTVNGVFFISSSSGTSKIALNASSVTATINGTYINGNGTNIFSGAGNVTISNGANVYLYGSGGIAASGSQNSGIAATTGAVRVTGTVTYQSGINFYLFATQGQSTGTGFPTTVNNLTVGFTGGSTVTLSQGVTVSGTLTTSNSASLAVAANTLTLNGTSTSGINLTTTSSSSLSFGGSSSSVQIPSSVTALSGLTINNSNGVSLQSSLTISGTLTLTSGAFNVGSNTLTLNGAAIAGTATSLATTSSSNLSIGSSFAGTTIPSSVTALNNLAISKAVSLQAALTLSGTLSLTAILTTTSINLLTLVGGLATTSAGSSTAYVNGPLAWQLPASASSTTYLYPIGASSVYAPFSLTSTSTTSSSSLAVVQAQVTHGSTGGSAGTGVSVLNSTNWWQTIVTNASSISGVQLQFTDPGNSSATTIATSSSQGGSYSAISTSTSSNTFTSSSIVAPASSFYVFATASTPSPVVTSGGSQSISYGSAITSYQISATNSPSSYSVTYNSIDLNSAGIGLSYSTSNGLISGTPTISGTITLTIGATNGGGTGSGTYTINSSATVYYISGAVNNPSNWNTAANGSGIAAPTGVFSDANITFNILQSASTTGGAWTLGTGSIINVGQVSDATSGVTLTVTSGNYITGTINVYGNTLELQDATHIPTLGTLDATSTIQYDATGSQSVANTTYNGNLVVGNSSNAATTASIPAITVTGAFTENTGATVTITSASPTFNGNFTQNSGSTLTLTTGSPNLNGNVYIYGSVSFLSTSYFYLGNTSYLTVYTGATLTVSNGYGAVQNQSATGSSGLGPIRSNASATTYPWSTYVTFQSGVNWILTSTNATPYLGNGFPSAVGNLTLNAVPGTNAFAMTTSGNTGGPGNLIVNGTLTFTSGKLAVGANTLTLNGPSIAGTSASLVTTTSSNLVFGGSSSSVVFPSGVTSLGGLTINNSNGVALLSSLSLSGVLTLTSGVLNTTSGTLNFVSGASVSGGSSTSYVNGPASWTLPLSASGATYTFPLGTSGGGYTPLSLTSTSTAASGSNPVVTAQVYNSAAASLSAVNSPLTSINTNNYWTTSITNASVLTSTAVQLTDPSYGSANAIAYSNTQAGNYSYLGGSSTGSTFTGASASTVYGYYVLGYAAVPAISSGNTATASFGTTYTSGSPIYTIVASNSPSYSAVLSPSNAALSTIGLSVDASSGKITGTPNTFGTFSIAISATNGAGTSSASVTLNISGYLYYNSGGTGALDNYANWYSGTSGSGTQAPSGVFSLANATFEIDNSVSTAGTSSGWTVSGSGSKIVVGGTSTTLTVANGYPIMGTIAIAAGSNTLVLQDPNIPTFGTLNSASTVNYASTTAIQTITASITYGNLVVSNSYIPSSVITSGTASGAYVATSSTVTIATSLTVNNGGVLFISGGGSSGNSTISLNSGATATINSGGIFISGQGGSSTFSGAGNLSINNGANIYLYGAQGITKTGSLNSGTAATSGAFRVAGTVTYGTGINFYFFSGQAQATGTGFPSTVNNLTIGYFSSSTITQTASTNITVNGTLTTSNSASYAVGANTLTLNSASTSGIKLTTTSSSSLAFTGSAASVAIPSSVTALSGLTINNANGVSLNSNLTVTTLTLTSGNLSLGSNNLTASTISGGGTSSYIVTNGTGLFTKNAITANLTLPVGTATYYAPLSFATATSNNVTVGVAGAFTNTPVVVNNTVALQWSLLASGSYTSNVTFQYNAGNKGSGYSSTGAILGTYSGSTYAESALGTVAGTGPYTITASSLALPTSVASLYGIGNPYSFFNIVPNAPASVSALDSDNSAIVVFTAPASNGGSAITGYTVTSNPSNITATGSASPIKILGLTNGTSYTFTVTATNLVGTGAASAASNSVIPSATTTWNGIAWSAGPPTSVSNAVINANISNTQWGGATSVAYLTVNSGYTFGLTGTVTITNNANTALTNNGTISGGTIVLGGSAAQTVGGTGIVAGLTINNAAGVTVSSGSNNLGVSGVLTLQSGTLTTNGNVTLKSLSIAKSGVVAPIGVNGNTGTITGNVTVERYIPAGYRGYRDLAPQVYSAGSIYNNWQEGGSLTHNGYGIFITGPTSTDATLADYNAGQIAANSTTGLDYSLNGISSAYTFNNGNGTFYSQYAAGKIDSIINTKTTNLDVFTGYRVLVRGDRSFNLATSPILNYPAGLRMYNPTTIRATGSLVYGTVTYSTTGVTGTANGGTITSTNALNANATVITNGKITQGLSEVANPYVSPVSWDSVYHNSVAAGSNINGTWYFLDPTYSATGTYEGYNFATGSQFSDEANSSDFIQAGQAFFVLNAASSPTPKVVFTEQAKQTSSTKLSVFGATAPLSKIYIGVFKETNGSYSRTDGAAVAFRSDFTDKSFGPQDALKVGYGSDNIAVSDKGVELGIDGRLPASASDAIALKIGSPTATTYQLQLDASRYIDNGFAPLLYDAYKNTTTTLGSGLTTVNFTVDANTAASYANRFSILFNPSALAVNSIVASATLNDKVATITWNTVGEKGESYYEVEKSTDGKNFNSISQQTAKNTSIASYTATDKSVVEGNNYYRIKAVSETGAVNYSNVVKLSTNNSPLTTIYPNPLIGRTLNVALNNVAKGKYVVSISNVLGQKVNEQTISHLGGSATYPISINGVLAAGVYNVSIIEASSKQVVSQTNLSVQK